MNGISLLLLLSSIGATTSVEMSTNGQPIYTIRIESLLINDLRNGQTIPILVAPKDRRIRNFRIAITPEGNLRSGSARATDLNSRPGDLFDYEPTQYENGDIEYVVQISPERLESLAAGKAIDGEIAADIPEVHRFLIFVGIGQLPSQLQNTAQQQAAAQQQGVALVGNGNPPSLLRGAEVRATPASQPRTVANNTTTPSVKAPFQTAQPTGTRGFQSNDPLTQFNTRTNDARTNWRNQPDQSTISPPPFASVGQPPATTNSAFPRSGGVQGTTDRNGYPTQPTYNNGYQQPPYSDPNAGYAQQNPNAYQQQGYPVNTTVPYQQQQQPPITIAARNDVPPGNQPMQANTGWNQPAPVAQANTLPANTATTPTTTSGKIEPEKDRPWTPLILTTLALFASLGANAYLGWLSWSFFWRFRDAVTESARTRAQISTTRQAA